MFETIRIGPAFACSLLLVAAAGPLRAVQVPGMSQADARSVEAGEALYVANCAECHDAGVPGAIPRSRLGQLPADLVDAALTTGAMATVGARLTEFERTRLVQYLGTLEVGLATATPNPCAAAPRPLGLEGEPAWNGWGGSMEQHRYQSSASAGLTPEEVPRLRLKWAFAFAGAVQAFGQPTVVSSRLFVGSADGTVYSLDAASGCEHWRFAASAPVRTAMTVAERGGRWLVFFGDQAGDAYALDADTGQLAWRTEVDDHPTAAITGSPVLAGDRLIVPMSSAESGLAADPAYPCCTFRGSVSALDAATGRVLWKANTITDEPVPGRSSPTEVQNLGPSGAAVWSAPVVDLELGRVYAVTGNGYSDPVAGTTDAFLAFDLETGRRLWTRQVTAGDGFTADCDFGPLASNCPDANGPDHDLISPLLVDRPGGGRALVAGQKSGVVHALDPDADGALLWAERVGVGGRLGGVHWGIATDGRRVYVANADPVMALVPPNTPGAYPFGPPAAGLSFLADPREGGGLFALDLVTGAPDWQTPSPPCDDTPGCTPAQSAAVTAIPGIVFSGDLGGRLRAYSTETGEIVWEFDTMREFTAVNGVPARGGAIDGPGPVVVDGVLYVNSGYQFAGTAPGNVLLAFSVDGR